MQNVPVRIGRNQLAAFIVTLLLFALLTACDQRAVAPTQTPTPPATRLPTATLTTTPTSTPAPTFTPTLTAIHALSTTPTWTAAPIKPTEVVNCPGAPDSMLKLDRLAQVSIDPPIANRIRSEPDSGAEIIGLAAPGETVLIESGPHCADGYAWWYVRGFNGLEGWTAEGDATGYWLIPLKPDPSVLDSEQHTVTLTAGQVHSAIEIEDAIIRATERGSRPGIVILDGRDGPFVYTGDDTSLNIFVSNLTLVGVNQAKIENCGDGLFFDDFPLQNIRVEGIEFVCKGHGVWTGSAFNNVTLRNNIFRTGLVAINMVGESHDWLIEQNLIVTYANGIEITGANKIVMTNNYISGWVGILLRHCSEFQISKNIIQGNLWGVQLVQESAKNWVQKNLVHYERYAGIILVEGVKENQILSNTVSCTPGADCLSVDAAPDVAEVNTITGNLP